MITNIVNFAKRLISLPSCFAVALTALSVVAGLANNIAHATSTLSEDVANVQRRCNLNQGIACAALGLLYEVGHGVDQNLATAKQLYQKGCSLDDGLSCAFLGLLYVQGRGVDQDLATAKQLYQKGCNLNIWLSCRWLGQIYLQQIANHLNNAEHIASQDIKDIAKAKQFFQEACRLEDKASCEMANKLP